MAASINDRMGWRPAAQDGLRRLVPLAALVGIVLAIVLLAGMGDIVLQRRVIFCLVHVVAVVGLYIFMGNSGVMNFSSAGFMAVGAYTSALLTMAPGMKSTFLPDLPAWLAAAHLSPLWGALAGGVVAGLLALVIGIPIMRLSGIGAAIATLSLMFICYIVLGNWTALTGGQQSLMGLPSYVGLWTAGLTAMAAIAVAFVYQETRGALALRGSREDEVAARGSGVRIVRERLVAFVVSGFVTGIAGVLYGHFLGTLRVESFYLDLTFLLVTMLVVGGMRSLAGAVIGAIGISILTELLRLVEVGFVLPGTSWSIATPPGLGDVALAAAMLLIILFRPQGLTGGREIELPRSKTSTSGLATTSGNTGTANV
jgi:branched-chain amino acid transport system permease protein